MTDRHVEGNSGNLLANEYIKRGVRTNCNSENTAFANTVLLSSAN
jgi:hypothetical protein